MDFLLRSISVISGVHHNTTFAVSPTCLANDAIIASSSNNVMSLLGAVHGIIFWMGEFVS